MPQVNLSNLSGPELRGLLDSARQRGLAAQSYEILQEMAARRAQAEGSKPSKRSAGKGEPRVIAVDLGDPLDRPDELVDPVVEPPPPSEPLDDIGMDLAQAVQDRSPRRKPARERKARPSVAGPQAVRRKRWPGVVFAAGIAVGVLLGCGLALDSLTKPDAPAVAVFPQAPMLRPEQVPPPAAPPVEVVQAEAPAPPAEAPAPELAATEAEQAAVPASAEQVENPNAMDEKLAELASAEPPASERCARASTPADRTICEEPRLKDLQQRLRDAYAEALDAHADRALLRQHQLAWRDARNEVSDPERLARLYEARIRKLNAAAEEARKAR
jgi:uncharacterized protein YecT (DUF1311 family)